MATIKQNYATTFVSFVSNECTKNSLPPSIKLLFVLQSLELMSNITAFVCDHP